MSEINQRLRFLTGIAAERVRLSEEIQVTVEGISREEKNIILAIDPKEIAGFGLDQAAARPSWRAHGAARADPS